MNNQVVGVAQAVDGATNPHITPQQFRVVLPTGESLGEVLADLQDQIDDLEERVEALELLNPG